MQLVRIVSVHDSEKSEKKFENVKEQSLLEIQLWFGVDGFLVFGLVFWGIFVVVVVLIEKHQSK